MRLNDDAVGSSSGVGSLASSMQASGHGVDVTHPGGASAAIEACQSVSRSVGRRTAMQRLHSTALYTRPPA